MVARAMLLVLFAACCIAMANARMAQYALNGSDFCAMKVIIRCFTSSKMGLPRQTCGAQSVFELAREGVGNRQNCMQPTKITKWLQTAQIDTVALKQEITGNCGAFQQIHRCVDPYKEMCADMFDKFGLNMFLVQWDYICDNDMYPRMEKHILCRREVADSANDECRYFAPVLGIKFENATVRANMTEAECKKFKLILGCRARVLLAHCSKENGLLAAQFLFDFFNIQSKSLGSTCSIGDDTDPVKLASVYEKYVTELASRSGEETTTKSTTTTTIAPRRRMPGTTKAKFTLISYQYGNELDDRTFPFTDYYDAEPRYDDSTLPVVPCWVSVLMMTILSFIFTL